MPDSCRLHLDNDHENDVAADPWEAFVEACPTTEYTDDAQQQDNAPGYSNPTASRQAHRETSVIDCFIVSRHLLHMPISLHVAERTESQHMLVKLFTGIKSERLKQ